LSDKKNKEENSKEWSELDVSSLQSFDKELSNKTETTEPNFNLFKALYEDPELKEKNKFIRLYGVDKEADVETMGRGEAFKLLYGGLDGDADDPAASSGSDKSAAGAASKNGFDEGFQQGSTQGYEEGFEQGRAEGFAQGKELGEKQGYDEGFETGKKEAEQRCDSSAAEIIGSLETVLLKAENTWQELVRQYENEILSLICKIAEKVVFATIELDKDVVRKTVLQALETLPEPVEITLNVAAEDYDYIEMIKEDFFEKINTLTSVSVISSSAVSRGGMHYRDIYCNR